MRDAKRLAAIRKLPCVMCGRTPVDAAHSNQGAHEKGMGLKACDSKTIPLCRQHHIEYDQLLTMTREQAVIWFDKMLEKTERMLNLKDDEVFFDIIKKNKRGIKMYRAWIEEDKAPDGAVEIEYDTLDEAKAALKVLEILAYNRNPWFKENHPNASPHEIAKEYVLCGILERVDGQWVDLKEQDVF